MDRYYARDWSSQQIIAEATEAGYGNDRNQFQSK